MTFDITHLPLWEGGSKAGGAGGVWVREGVPSKKAQCLGSHVLQERGWAGHLGLGRFLGWPQTDAARGINVDKDLAVFGQGQVMNQVPDHGLELNPGSRAWENKTI